MLNDLTETYFAPAERISIDEIRHQSLAVRHAPMLPTLMDCIQEMVLVLNANRQIVFANARFLDFGQVNSEEAVLGLRPGEAVGCVYALAPETPNGCGTSEFCRTCGAVRSILASQKTGMDIQECSILRTNGAEALNLRVRSTAMNLTDEFFTVFAIEDVSDEKRRQELERLFFHDILNTAGVVKGIADILNIAPPGEQALFRERIRLSANRLIDEINSQRVIAAAERNELVCSCENVSSLAFLRDITIIFQDHDSTTTRHLELADDCQDAALVTDPGLLSRVIVNMVKNALEATPEGGTVTVRCTNPGDRIRFEVHNPGAMQPDIALQIFKRSFSTKGHGRGLGTYSMRLLGERYLKGRIGFVSDPEKGTLFSATFPRLIL